MTMPLFLNSIEAFSNLLSSLENEENFRELEKDLAAIENAVDRYMLSNLWWENQLKLCGSHATMLTTRFSLFLAFQGRLQIEEVLQAGQADTDCLGMLMVFGKDIWPMYETRILGKPVRTVRYTNERVLEWLNSPNFRMALAEIGLAAEKIEFGSKIIEKYHDRSRSAISIWHTAGLNKFYEQIRLILDSEIGAVSEDVDGKVSSGSVFQVHNQKIDINLKNFTRAVGEIFPLHSPRAFELVRILKSKDTESRLVSELIPLGSQLNERYQIVGPSGSGKSSLLLAIWKNIAYNNDQYIIGLSPELAGKCQSLNDLIGYWLGKKDVDRQQISILCDDFDEFPILEQQRWASELRDITGLIVTAKDQIPFFKAEKLKIYGLERDAVFTYAEDRLGLRSAKRAISILQSPILTDYLTSLELVICFIDQCNDEKNVPSLIELARIIVDMRLGSIGNESEAIAIRLLCYKIATAIVSQKPQRISVVIQEIVKNDLEQNRLAQLLRCGFISIKDNKVSIHDKLIFHYMVYQNKHIDNINLFIQNHTRAERLYWRVASSIENGNLEDARENLFAFIQEPVGFQSGQWHQIANVLASLPNSSWSLEEVRILAKIYLAIQESFPSTSNWSVKDALLRNIPIPVHMYQNIEEYISSLKEFKARLTGIEQDPFENNRELIISILLDRTNPLQQRLHALSALRNYSPTDNVVVKTLLGKNELIALQELIKRHIVKENEVSLFFGGLELLILWKDNDLVERIFLENPSLFVSTDYSKHVQFLDATIKGDPDALSWI